MQRDPAAFQADNASWRTRPGPPQGRILLTAGLLFLIAMLVQLLAIAAVSRLRGSAAAYAYQSPDAAEYVELGRGLALHGRYSRTDAAGRILAGPDTWRTPGYPAVLALLIRGFGDSTPVLLLAQQVLAALSVPLLWVILRRYGSPRASIGLALAWCIDPFRIYYSLWLLAETLFTLVLLAGVWWYGHGRDRGWTIGRAMVLGAVAGVIVLVRPIGILLPLLAMMGVAVGGLRQGGSRRGAHGERHGRVSGRGRGWVRGFAPVIACVAGSALVVTPWLVRNRLVAGHFALSHQSGASLAYHKVMDVLLWSRGRSAERFDPHVHDEIRSQIDARLRAAWEARFGPLTVNEQSALTWHRLNYDLPVAVDPFVASQLLTQVSLALLREHWTAAMACFAVQGISMLVFPLGLLIAPPAGAGSAPLSLLGGGGAASRAAAALIGLAYAGLLVLVLWRLWTAVWERRRGRHLFIIWPLLALFVLSVPSEDPRFRLPLVPLMLILALPADGSEKVRK